MKKGSAHCFSPFRFLHQAESRPTSDRGMAIPLVMLIGVLLFIFMSILMFRNTFNKRVNKGDIQRRKALYVALGGMQHALLKVTLLPTECYDGLLISQVRNPYHDFKKPINNDIRSKDYNPGPMFLALEGKREEYLARYSGTDEDPMSGELNTLIRFFMQDIRYPEDDGIREQPFRHRYEVTKLKVLSMKETKKYYRETVDLIIRGAVWDIHGNMKEDTASRTIIVEHDSVEVSLP